MAGRRRHDRTLPWIAQALLDRGLTGVALLAGPDFTYAYANQLYRAIAPDRPLLGRPFAQVFPELAAEFVPILRQVRDTGLDYRATDRRVDVRRQVDGPLVEAWWCFAFQRVAWGDGAVAIHVLDRTSEAARLQAELASDAATRRAAELAAVLGAIADGLVLSNRENELERANAAARRLLGELAPGSDWLQRFTVSDVAGRAVAGPALPPVRALAGEVVHGQELRLTPREPGGAPTWLSVSAAPIRDPGQAIQGVVTTFTDITRLHELQERQADLLRAIGHDLRTPLTVVLTQAQLLQRHPEDAAAVERRAATLSTSAQRMAAMIDDLADLVRLEAGLVTLQPRPVSLKPFAEELRERLRGTLPVERLRLEVPAGLPPAHADPPRLERILVNLISNALKYSPPETEASLSAAAVDGQVRLTVADRGPGLPADEAARVFDRFYRSASAGGKEGLGLGLYISRLLVEAHGGRIWVESQPGQGASFHVTLPLAAAAA